MAKKCGCASQKCSCTFQNSASVTVTGIGTPEDPYVAHRTLPLGVVDSSSLDLSLDSTDTEMTLSAQALGHGAQVALYTANATWNRPSGIQAARIMLVGGGGGGSGGAGGGGIYGSNSNIGAPGGGGGGYTFATLYGTDIPSSAAITVGAGGTGGIGSTGAGGVGGNGGTSSFGSLLYAYGGVGGDYSFILGQGGNGVVKGGDGLNLLTPGVTDVQAVNRLAPGGGGYGAAASNLPTQGWPGGYCAPCGGSTPPSQLASSVDGIVNTATLCGGGGGGGYTIDTVKGVPGFSGGIYGGGGGGGASFMGSATGTNGGSGAPGVVMVIVW